jgi:long-chain acyl-CoA synthetase
MMPNILQYPIAIFGALKAGLIVVNVNPLYTAREITEQLNDASTETIIVLKILQIDWKKIPHTTLKHVVITKIGDLLDFKGNMINFVVRYCQKQIPHYHLPNAIFKTPLSLENKPLFILLIFSFRYGFLQYTGGTTGRSKRQYFHRNHIANVAMCCLDS